MNNKGKRAVYFTSGDSTYRKDERIVSPGKFSKKDRNAHSKIIGINYEG